MATFHDLLNNIEQVYDNDIDRIVNEYNRILFNNDQLKLENNQLRLDNEQLRLDNEQFRMDNEQFRMDNEQLRHEQLRHEYNRLKDNPIYSLLNQLLEQHKTLLATEPVNVVDEVEPQKTPNKPIRPNKQYKPEGSLLATEPVNVVDEVEPQKTPNKPIRPNKQYDPEGSLSVNNDISVKHITPPITQLVIKQPISTTPSIQKLEGKRGRGRPKKIKADELTDEKEDEEDKIINKHNPKLAQGDFTLGKKLLDNSWLENKTDDFIASTVANLYNNLNGKTPNTIENRDFAISNFIMGFNHVNHHTNYSYIVQNGKGKGRVKEVEKNIPNVDYVDNLQLVSRLGLTLDDDGFVCRLY